MKVGAKVTMLVLVAVLMAGCFGNVRRQVIALTPEPNKCEKFAVTEILDGATWVVCYDREGRPFGMTSGNAQSGLDAFRAVVEPVVVVGVGVYAADRIASGVKSITNVTVTAP